MPCRRGCGAVAHATKTGWLVRSEPLTFTGSCPIREHTGDGAYVGRCEHATYDGYCPRHGALEDYPTNDDREVRVQDRRMA